MEVKELVMPKRPPCTGIDTNETTVIWVYKRSSAVVRTNANLYLRSDCLDWLFSYAADEPHHLEAANAHLQAANVAVGDPAASAKEAAECTAVADYRLTWDVYDQAWEAHFVAGPFKGKRYDVCLSDLCQAQWKKMKYKGMVCGCLAHATNLARKDFAEDLLRMWCDAIARHQGSLFEREWGVGEFLLAGPKKRRRTNQYATTAVAGPADADDAAVADADG